MKIQPVTDENGNILRWESVNLIDGYDLILSETDDKSGIICRIIDHYTGEMIDRTIGSSVHSAANFAVERMNKFALSPTFVFA